MNKYDIFDRFQPPILAIANNSFGRKYLGIDKECRGKIARVTPNSYAVQVGRNKYKEIFRCYDLFGRKLELGIKLGSVLGLGSFAPQVAPLFALVTTNFFPAAGDGSVYRGPEADSWTNVRAQATGTTVTYLTQPTYMAIANRNDTTRTLGRSFFPIDTSALTAGAVIIAGGNKFHWQFSSWGADTGTRPTFTLVESTVVSTTVLAIEDYDLVGSTEFTATRFDTAGKVADTDYTITLDTDGDAAISKTSFTKLAIRTNYDFDNSDPTSITQQEILAYFSEQAGTDKDPYLEITYSLGNSGLQSKIW